MNPTTDLRVLVVDDDFRVAALHARYVDDVPGFTALPPVHDARMVPRAVAEGKPDLLLLDVYLPQGSGLDLLATLDVDAFVLSAATEVDAVRTAIRRGALGYLVKPFDPKVLATRLRSYARYRRQLDSATVLDQGAIDRAQRTLLAGDEERYRGRGYAHRTGGACRGGRHRRTCNGHAGGLDRGHLPPGHGPTLPGDTRPGGFAGA